MTDDLSLAPEVVEAQLAERPATVRDPWLERRDLGFGSSDLAPLLMALGVEPVGHVPKYLEESARLILRRKAGLARPARGGQAAAGGQRRERLVLSRWRDEGCPGTDVLPSSVHHADKIPREWLPLVDRHEPRLLATPDGWAQDVSDALVHIEIKTTFQPSYDRPWHHWVQVQGAMAVTGSAYAVIVCALGAADMRRELAACDLDVWTVEREEPAIRQIREACAEGWRRVEQMKKGAVAA